MYHRVKIVPIRHRAFGAPLHFPDAVRPDREDLARNLHPHLSARDGAYPQPVGFGGELHRAAGFDHLYPKGDVLRNRHGLILREEGGREGYVCFGSHRLAVNAVACGGFGIPG